MYNDSYKFSFSSPRERIKEKMKSSISCFGWTPYIEISVAMGQIEEEVKKSRTPRTPHIKEKCKSFISRIGKGGRKQYNSSDFSYDPLSYALNFEDETHLADKLQNNIMNFTSRLPPTPDRAPVIKSFQPTPVSIRRELFAHC
ncbi:hypothetical protein ERO13_A05G056900v2 [Gossypium hirsutum]|uniref:Uncharacterized protein n=5 Tax=Gossypium TaxID=3633 RepID=A0A2P5WPH9_GOSBA|nr:uncharacterized protein LOC107960817 [Gossypium hirsutum]XP_017628609.1 uncharacterized protein LOC108471509 [Gossypium arboreum]KAB2080254.1 hypothetical protein ES319_A05G058400v1 [Gossypium barbadense]KAG4197935.1 hypothetical protein ERO13_A05G056900v2 [Gossypium hirsutum]KAK5830238.1 hypothetical protein PVK06_014032 [Gossypium arboreum]PPR92999.1 hypothetical protein GOBAR_AA27672 [Gossypium barbadense]